MVYCSRTQSSSAPPKHTMHLNLIAWTSHTLFMCVCVTTKLLSATPKTRFTTPKTTNKTNKTRPYPVSDNHQSIGGARKHTFHMYISRAFPPPHRLLLFKFIIIFVYIYVQGHGTTRTTTLTRIRRRTRNLQVYTSFPSSDFYIFRSQ